MIVVMAYAVVIFTVVVQGLTLAPLLLRLAPAQSLPGRASSHRVRRRHELEADDGAAAAGPPDPEVRRNIESRVLAVASSNSARRV